MAPEAFTDRIETGDGVREKGGRHSKGPQTRGSKGGWMHEDDSLRTRDANSTKGAK